MAKRVFEVHIRAPSYIRYGYIPTRIEDAAFDFFPDVEKPFSLLTEYGTIWAWVTSKRTYNNHPGTGNFINTISDSGLSIKQLYSLWKVTVDDILRFEKNSAGFKLLLKRKIKKRK